MKRSLSSFRSVAAAVALLTAGAVGAIAWSAEAAPAPSPLPTPAPAEPPVATTYTPITPCRLADTRPAPDNVGDRVGKIGPGEAHTFNGRGAVGNCQLSTTSVALSLNVTAVAATTQTNLRLYDTGKNPPLAANLNPGPGQAPTPNAVNVPLNSLGQFDLFNEFGSVHVVIDVVGVYELERPTRPERVSVGGIAFQPRNSNYEYSVDGPDGAWVTGPSNLNGAIMYAPLQLPDGARMDSATVSFVDAALFEDLEVRLICDSLTSASRNTIFTFQSAGTQGLTSSAMSPFGNRTVDNEACAYGVQAFSSTWTTVTSLIRINGVTVELTTPR